jgi:hypothetical protein
MGGGPGYLDRLPNLSSCDALGDPAMTDRLAMRSGKHRQRSSRPRDSLAALLLKVLAPSVVTLIAFASVVYLLFLAQTEFLLFDHGHAPEDAARLTGIAAVIVLTLATTVIVHRLMTHAGPQSHPERQTGLLHDGLSIAALATLGTAFAVLDMTFCIGESTDAVLIALMLGLGAAAPLLLHRAVRVRTLLVSIGVYCLFAGWIVVQREIDWNMSRHFRRAYSQIRAGMTMEQVKAVMHQQFRGKRPVGRFDDWGAQYTLDPDDGRFNSEFIIIQMVDGKVASADYLPD